MLQKTAEANLFATNNEPRTDYRRDIDGLRAIAVLSVVAFHAFPLWAPGGFIGVDVFFVISGYLISGHIFAALEQGTFSFAGFYARRIRRIFPALCVVLAACLVFGWFALLTDEYLQLGKHVAAGAGFVSNLVLWQEAGYFDNTAGTKPLLHLWSLGVEEQFYIVWPLAAVALWKLRAKLLLAIVLIAAVSFALNTEYMRADPTLDFFSPFTRFWELLAGAALAQHERDKGFTYDPIVSNVQSFAGAILLLIGFAYTREHMIFPGWVAILAVAGSVLLIAAGPNAFWNRIGLSAWPLVAIGLISYPLYLWHWPLLSFTQIVESSFPTRSVRIALVVAAIVLAAATYWLVEKPLRFGRWKRIKLIVLLTAMAVIGFLGFKVFTAGGLPDRPALTKLKAASAQFVASPWKFAKNLRCVIRYPFDEANEYGWWFCMANKDAPPTLMLLGNSYANQLYPGLMFEPRLAEHSVVSIGTCSAIEQDAPDEDAKANGQYPCSGKRWYHQQQFLDRIITENTSLKYVIVDGLPPKPTRSEVDRILRRVGFLVEAGKQVVVFTPHLRTGHDIKGCFERPFKSTTFNCLISATERERWKKNFAPVVDGIARSYPTVKVFDQNEAFCGFLGCSLVIDGMPMFRDQYNHLSVFGSRRVAGMFADWAAVNLPGLLRSGERRQSEPH